MLRIHSLQQLFALTAVVAAILAAIILIWYLVRQPPLSKAIKVWLLAGLGALPILVALTGNVAAYEQTKEREFCGACHVMGLRPRRSRSQVAKPGCHPRSKPAIRVRELLSLPRRLRALRRRGDEAQRPQAPLVLRKGLHRHRP